MEIDTPGTATAEQITVGYTAWVNGELITGTRPTAVTTLSGTESRYVGTSVGTKYTIAVVFDTPFDTLPTISLSLVSAIGDKGGNAASRTTYGYQDVTLSGFVIWLKNSSDDYGQTCKVSWIASAS